MTLLTFSYLEFHTWNIIQLLYRNTIHPKKKIVTSHENPGITLLYKNFFSMNTYSGIMSGSGAVSKHICNNMLTVCKCCLDCFDMPRPLRDLQKMLDLAYLVYLQWPFKVHFSLTVKGSPVVMNLKKMKMKGHCKKVKWAMTIPRRKIWQNYLQVSYLHLHSVASVPGFGVILIKYRQRCPRFLHQHDQWLHIHERYHSYFPHVFLKRT